MGRRPNRLLRWAHGTGATLVEPSSSKAETGYETEEEVPAGWLNSHLHLAGAWAGFLRGPHLGNWSRAAHAALTAYTEVFGMGADTVSVDGADPVYRFGIVGRESTTPTIRVSRRGIGAGWVSRAVPSGITGTLRGLVFVGRWLTWSATTGQIWSTIADDLSGDSAIGTSDATKWALVTSSSSIGTLRFYGAAWCAGLTGRAANARHAVVFADATSLSAELLVSVDSGSSWTSKSVSWGGGSAYTRSGAYDATRDRFVACSGLGGLALSPVGDPTGTWTVVSGPGIGVPLTAKIRTGGGTYLVFFTKLQNGTTDATPPGLYRTTDAGATWENLGADLPLEPGTADPVAMTDIAYADGVWVMTVEDAPYLYLSHDDGDTWERAPLPIGEESTWALSRVIYADGQVLATGVDFCVASGRAMATEDTTLVPDATPSILSDAYRLRGRTIATTAPTSGQVYAWNSGTSQWEPTSSLATTVTTTRGDMIRRGASTDERFALGTAGHVLRAGASDPGWSALSAAATSLPAAGAGYAATVYARSDLGTHHVCLWTGTEWAWRELGAWPGAAAENTTSDAAWTTIASTQITEDSVALLDVEVAGVKSDLSAGLVAKGQAGFANDGGTVTELEALTLSVGDPTRVQLAISGPDIEVQVKGVVSETWTWRVRVTRRLEVTP